MKVINSPEAELSTGRTVAKKKSPFKNTLKKKNGIYTSSYSSLSGAGGRAYARRPLANRFPRPLWSAGSATTKNFPPLISRPKHTDGDFPISQKSSNRDLLIGGPWNVAHDLNREFQERPRKEDEHEADN